MYLKHLFRADTLELTNTTFVVLSKIQKTQHRYPFPRQTVSTNGDLFHFILDGMRLTYPTFTAHEMNDLERGILSN